MRASATFKSAEHAIRPFADLMARLNDGYINVSVSKRSARIAHDARQGGGKGRGKAGGIAFSEHQRTSSTIKECSKAKNEISAFNRAKAQQRMAVEGVRGPVGGQQQRRRRRL